MEPTTDPQRIGTALNWLVSLLNRHGVPYQIVGGLAAQAYGATRPLVDIDLYIPYKQAREVLKEIRPYLVLKPKRRHNASWNLVCLALDYQGMYFDICDSLTNPRFYNCRDQHWEQQFIEYARSTLVMLYGVEVAVMQKDELIAYKTVLNRDVDRQDVQELGADPL